MALSVCAVMCAEGARVLARPGTKGAGEGLFAGRRGGAGWGSPRCWVLPLLLCADGVAGASGLCRPEAGRRTC